MAKNINEAINEAIMELKQNPDVVEVEYIPQADEKIVCKHVTITLAVFHKAENEDGYCYSMKTLYVNVQDFTYKWRFGGVPITSKTKSELTS